VEDYNIIPLMAVSDTLISEASSTVFDFLAMSKIGIIYDLDHDNLKHSDGEHILTTDNREFLKDAFVHINKPDKIGDAVTSALNPTESMLKKADEYRDYFFYKLDGKASNRLKDTVENLISERS
jgi:CDP-glycerol glycerophosphotransferase (TagB/SpsB family)